MAQQPSVLSLPGGDFRRDGSVPLGRTLRFVPSGQILEAQRVASAGDGVELSAQNILELGTAGGWGGKVDVPAGGLTLQGGIAILGNAASANAPLTRPLELTGGPVTMNLANGGSFTVSGGSVDLNGGNATVGSGQVSWSANMSVQSGTGVTLEPGALATGECVLWDGIGTTSTFLCSREASNQTVASSDPVAVLEQGDSALEFYPRRLFGATNRAIVYLKAPSGARYPMFGLDMYSSQSTTRFYSSGQTKLMLHSVDPIGFYANINANNNRVFGASTDNLTDAVSWGRAKDKFLFVRFASTTTPGVLTTVDTAPGSFYQSEDQTYSFSAGAFSFGTLLYPVIASVTATFALTGGSSASHSYVRLTGPHTTVEASEQLINLSGATEPERTTVCQTLYLSPSSSGPSTFSWGTTGPVTLETAAVVLQASSY